MKRETLQGLFTYASRTLLALIVVEVMILVLYLPKVGEILYLWFALTTAVIISRLYDAYFFHKEPRRFALAVWHRKFALKAWLTALLFTVLLLCVTPLLEAYDRLFVFTILLGISGGAVSSLSSDHRVALGYIVILLLPLSLEMMFFVVGINSFVLGLLLLLYFFTLVSVILQASEQKELLESKNEEILRVESALYEKEEMLELFFDQAPIGIFTYNTDLVITDCNRVFLDLFGIKKDEIVGLDLKALPDQSPMVPMRNALVRGAQTYIGPYTSLKGYHFWVEAKISPLYSSTQEIVGGIVLLENKTKEHNALKELEFLVQHDTLTTLSNRRGFKRFMEEMVADEKHQEYYSALFYLDLNHFKQINDSLGHNIGDKVLVSIAKRLRNTMEDARNITRLGGDEFIVVIPFLARTEEETRKDIEKYVARIEALFNDPFMIEGVRLHIKSSIGIVIIEPGFDNIEEIVRHADISMYEAKRGGQGHISYYNTELDRERKKIFQLQHQLATSLDNDELEIYYQPITAIKDDHLYAAEALIRWKHSQHGLMGADAFIPIAVESGIVVEIGWWVIEHVCMQIARWKSEGVWSLAYLSININAKQLLQDDFASAFITILKKHGVESGDIRIEVTETSLIDNFELTQEVILTLQKSGIACAIDDFGTGYSSLSYLKKLSFSILKIDREFIHELEMNREHIELIHTMINIGKQFNYTIIVEGIENEAQREIIREIDDSLYYQGFLFSKPVRSDLFRSKFLAKDQKTI